MCATRCRDPFRHFPDLVLDLPCEHQTEVYECGCTCSDHNHEPCDGVPVAQLEEVR